MQSKSPFSRQCKKAPPYNCARTSFQYKSKGSALWSLCLLLTLQIISATTCPSRATGSELTEPCDQYTTSAWWHDIKPDTGCFLKKPGEDGEQATYTATEVTSIDACAQKCLEWTGGCKSFVHHGSATSAQTACLVFDVVEATESVPGVTCEAETDSKFALFGDMDAAPAANDPSTQACTHTEAGKAI